MYDPSSQIARYKDEVEASVKSSRQRNRLMNKLTEEAQAAHKTGRYEISYDHFVHLLAIIQLDPSTKYPSETTATITSNIASALHFLGELSLASEFYETALKEFGDARVGWITWVQRGNLNEKRMLYIQARLSQVATGERPDPSLYQDGYGKTRKWTQEEMDGTDKSWSVFQPRTWWYGGYVPAGHTVPSRDVPSAATTAI